MLFAFLRMVARGELRDKKSKKRVHSVLFKNLVWLAREERGEIGDRYHYHVLLDGLPLARRNRVETFVWKRLWTQLGGGFIDARPFDARLSGAAYVLKGLDTWSYTQANHYELTKFGQDADGRELIVSDSCASVWGGGPPTRDGATGGTPNADKSGVSPSAGRKARTMRIKEVSAKQAQSRHYVLHSHPAGPSFVR